MRSISSPLSLVNYTLYYSRIKNGCFETKKEMFKMNWQSKRERSMREKKKSSTDDVLELSIQSVFWSAWMFMRVRIHVCVQRCQSFGTSILLFIWPNIGNWCYTCIESSQENIHNQPYYITNYKIPSRSSNTIIYFVLCDFFSIFLSFLFFSICSSVFMVKFVFLFFCSFHFWLWPDLSIYLCEFNCGVFVCKSCGSKSVAVQADDVSWL